MKERPAETLWRLKTAAKRTLRCCTCKNEQTKTLTRARCLSRSTSSRHAPATARDRLGSGVGQLHAGASRQALPEAHAPPLSLPARPFPAVGGELGGCTPAGVGA